MPTKKQTSLNVFDLKKEYKFEQGEVVDFELVATVNHLGDSVEKGHYVCHEFNGNSGKRIIDDSTVN